MCPFGTGTYVLGFAAGEISKTHPWLRISAAETPGFIYNIKAVNANPATWDKTIIGSGGGVLDLASKGLPPVGEKIRGYKFLLNTIITGNHLVTLNPDIKTPQDLIGKKVALGYKTQINWGYQMDVILRDGLGIIDQMDVSYVGTTPAKDALLDGLVDAAVTGIYWNPLTGDVQLSPVLTALMGTGRPLYFISWGEEAIEKTVSKTGHPLTVATIPAGATEWRTEDTVVGADTAGLGVKDIFSEELAYEVTKLYVDNYGKFGEYHNLGKLFSPGFLAWGWNKKTLHPGAVRAFEEAGVKIPD